MRHLIFLLFTMGVVIPALAQNGEIRGLLVDQSAVGISGAHIDIINRAGARVGRSTVSDRDGRYALINLNPGTYSVEYTANGFGTLVLNGVIVTEDNATSIQVTLKHYEGKHIEVLEYLKPLLDFQTVRVE